MMIRAGEPSTALSALGVRLIRLAVLAFLIVAGLTMVVPLFWMISTSLKPEGQVFLYPPKWIPEPIEWRNYITVTEKIPFVRMYINTALISVLATFGDLLTTSMAAFAFARLRFRLREPLFFLLLSTMMVPGAVTMIPVFLLMKMLGWVNTYLPLVVPAYFGGAFGTFMLRQFFLTLPRELDDAARMDGSTPLGIYWRIILPLAKPGLATLGVFVFLGNWNSFLGPIIYLNSPEQMTIQAGLSFFKGQYSTQYPLLMAGSVMALVPVIALYMLTQGFFVQAFVMSGIKG